ncbi:MAG: hypothetical protein QXP80_01535 [Zestosphaera sp.]
MGSLVLVSGLLPFNSGKTFFTMALASYLRDLGYSVTVAKPVSAHSIWDQYEYFLESLKLGVLVGEDVIKYMRADLIDDVDTQNPVDILTAPHDVMKHPSLDSYYTALTSVIEQAVLVRISVGEVRNHYVIGENLNKLEEHVAGEVRNLVVKLGVSTEADRGWLYSKLTSNEVDSLITESLRRLALKHAVVLCESFSNALFPVFGVSKMATHIVVVTPTRALIYGVKKTSTYLGTINRLKAESSIIVMLFKPDLILRIKPSLTPEGSLVETELRKLLNEFFTVQRRGDTQHNL